MAESAVYSVLAKLADPVIRALIDETLFLYGVRDKVDWLQRELRWMECFLKDAVAKRRRSGDELIKNWLREVREVAHEAEDIIDTFTLKSQKKRGLLPHIQRYASLPWNLHMFGTEIQGLKDKIDEIKVSRERYGLVNLTETTPSTSAAADDTLQTRRRLYPHLNDSTLVVGFDLHKKEIADRLLNPSIKRRCVSIVGIGGLGKTTLANKVYNDSRIKKEFNVFGCITVSQTYKVKEIIKVLVKQMMGKDEAELQSKDEVELGGMLRDFLIPRRYLIVLDDVWDNAVWDGLIRAALPDEDNGSRVLLTTRLLDVAKSIDPAPYELPFLNEGNSWTLFLNKAFPYREFSESIRCPEELEGIGRQLVKRCGGLPLALEVLGGILSKEPNSNAWKRVANHFDWNSPAGGDCSKILGLSYDSLPHHHIKSCFLYLGVFPEDSVIEAQALIELWIAEGFLPHELEPQLMEDRAHAYLEELANRSMIQVVDKVLLGSSAASSVSTLRIHDLFRDLCVREAREDILFNIYNTTTSNSSTTLQDTINNHGKNLRRLVIHGDISTTTSADCVNDLILPRNLKSILQFGQKCSSIIIPNGLKLLRVIHFVAMDNVYYEGFPKMFGKMRHLRYLRLSGPKIDGSVPPCIRNLCNLQTLDLSGYIRDLLPLPDWLVEMRTLRHFYLNRMGLNVSCLADGGRLDVDIDAGSEGAGLSGLEKLVNAQILRVRNLPRGEEEQLVFIDSLRKMKHLSILDVSGTMIPIEIFSVLSENTQLREMFLWGPMSVRQLPQSLLHGFPPNLTILTLMESKLAEDPMATLEKLPYLRELNLCNNAYKGKEMVCTSGGFPQLQMLTLYELEELEEWRVEDGAMPNLTQLHIGHCEKLRILPEGLQHLRSLRTLSLLGQFKDKSFTDRLRPQGEDWYKIQHVPHIIIQQVVSGARQLLFSSY